MTTDRARRAAVVPAFRQAMAADPGGVWSAPGRVNLIGEHTDYNAGLVLPLTIDRSAVVAAGLRRDGMARLVSLQMKDEVRVRLSEVRPGYAGGWESYPLGTLWALKEAGLAVAGVDLVFDSDIPAGAGLASSAALEVATALAVTELTGQPLDRLELARRCQAGENAIATAPTGIMDQLTALSGGAGRMLLLDCRSLQSELIAWRPHEASLALLVIDTAVRHANSTAGYRARRLQCEAAATALGVETLRDATRESVAAGLSGVLRRRATHVVSENQRVVAVAELLRAGNLAALGPLLTRSHISLRDDFEVSCAELDLAVETALAAGALGARMTGGGFGGSAIALVHGADVETVTASVTTAFARRSMGLPHIFPVVTSEGAHRLA